MIDRFAATRFVNLHGRLLERRRIAEDRAGTLAALAAYRNADGAFAFLEPDLPDPQGQPIAVLYALEVLHEAGDPDGLGAGALDWLATVSHADGGVPFVLPYDAEAVAHPPWLAPQDDPPSSLHITSALAAAAHRLGLEHPWLDGASAFTWEGIERGGLQGGYEMKYVIDFLDAVPDRGRADAALDRLAARLGGTDRIAVESGVEGEHLTALDVAPAPGHAGRRLFDAGAVERQLDELAAGQQADGGWTFPWLAWNDAVAWAWRGIVTVNALRTLGANGRLEEEARAEAEA
jgi:hypothetical protein